MKLMIDVRPLGKQPSGIGMYLYNFICGLRKYDDIHMELLTDVVESGEMQRLKEAHIPIHKYGKQVSKSIGVYAYFHFVQKKIHEVRPDIFWEGNNLMPAKIKNPYGKTVVTVYDVFPITMPEAYGRIYPHYFKFYLKRTLKNVDAVMYDSIESKNETERVMSVAKGVDNFLVYSVVDVTPNTDISDEGYFLYIGNLEKRKGTDILLKAYSLYRKQGGTRELILAGRVREKEIEELLEQTSFETEGVTYAGYVDNRKKDELLARCGCFVFPSRAEGFGIPVIEAMAYGKPVLGSNLTIFEEITEGEIQNFELDESPDKSAINLTEKMLDVKPIDASRVAKIVQKYKSEKLVQTLKTYFDKIAG